ncbi:hypothetical protein SUGI_1011470 [Cryptomeria japonica]|nr:hypothetical protein SUGI_1011470 [Cryptomeria japonica]
MEALKLTRVLKSNIGHVGLTNYANKSWRINLDRRQVVASYKSWRINLDGPSTRYLQQKQVDLFIRPLTQSHMDQDKDEDDDDEEMVVAAEAADRAEMHDVLAQQRDGFNKLLLPSLTNITLAALILQALPNNDTNNVVATLLYGFSTALMCGVSKMQPSQLAEEQRIAARLFRQLNTDIHTNLALPPYKAVLALDEAYPLPVFPELETELRGVSETLKSGDIAEYVGLSRKVLGVNSILAIAGPLLTGIAGALNLNGAMLSMSMVAGVLGVVGNTLSHSGEVGMVFEMYRNCAGFYHLPDSSISDTLNEAEPEARENRELFRWRFALQLGRDPHSPLADSASKFAGKLF